MLYISNPITWCTNRYNAKLLQLLRELAILKSRWTVKMGNYLVLALNCSGVCCVCRLKYLKKLVVSSNPEA